MHSLVKPIGLAAVLGVLAPPVFAAADAPACEAVADGASLRVSVENITSSEGNLRAQIYSEDAAEWLEKGKKLVRVEVPAVLGEAEMCVPLPGPGRYALVVLHDRNANGKADIFTEGFGFSNNPKLGLSKPDHEKVVFVARRGVTEQDVTMHYLLGSDAEKAKRRRARRR